MILLIKAIVVGLNMLTLIGLNILTLIGLNMLTLIGPNMLTLNPNQKKLKCDCFSMPIKQNFIINNTINNQDLLNKPLIEQWKINLTVLNTFKMSRN